MKYCRFVLNGNATYGLVEATAGREMITRLLTSSPEIGGDLEDVPSKKMDAQLLAEASLLVPVTPSKIVCIGRNYRDHAAELGHAVPTEPIIFLKPPSSLINPGQAIKRPQASQRVDYEGELGVIMGKVCHRLADGEDVRPYILGYTCVNDVTARDFQQKDEQWTRAKGFDTFCPVGPVVSDEVDPWAGVDVETKVNGELRQKGNTRNFIFALDAVVRYISRIMTLLPGDLISTGTPEGVGPVVAGDRVEVEVSGVGILSNPVVNEQL